MSRKGMWVLSGAVGLSAVAVICFAWLWYDHGLTPIPIGQKVNAADVSDAKPASAPTVADVGEDFIIAQTSTAAFVYGGRTYRIYPSLYNRPDEPTRWQFRYDPVFHPQVNDKGELDITKRQEANGKWLVSLPLWMDVLPVGSEPGARDLALESVRKAYPDVADKIQPNSIQVLPIKNLQLSIDQLKDPDLRDKATLLTVDRNFNEVPQEVFLDIETTKAGDSAKAVADMVATELPNWGISYDMRFSAKVVLQNFVTIKMTQLQNTSLQTKLDGLAGDNVYIHRHDLRNLCNGIYMGIDWRGVIEDPGALDDAIFKALVNDWGKQATIDFATQWQAVQKSTFNAKDLDPDEITKSLNSVFELDQGKCHVKKDVKWDTGGSMNYLDLLSASGHLNGEWSEEELREFLKQRGITASFEGDKIVAKGLDVIQINKGDFRNESKVVQDVMNVRGSVAKAQQGFIDLRFAKPGAPDVQTRVADLETGLKTLRTDLDSGLGTLRARQLHLVQSSPITVTSNQDVAKANPGAVFFVPDINGPRPNGAAFQEPGDRITEVDLPACKGKTIVAAWPSFDGHGDGYNAFLRLHVLHDQQKPMPDQLFLYATRQGGNAGLGSTSFVIYALYTDP